MEPQWKEWREEAQCQPRPNAKLPWKFADYQSTDCKKFWSSIVVFMQMLTYVPVETIADIFSPVTEQRQCEYGVEDETRCAR